MEREPAVSRGGQPGWGVGKPRTRATRRVPRMRGDGEGPTTRRVLALPRSTWQGPVKANLTSLPPPHLPGARAPGAPSPDPGCLLPSLRLPPLAHSRAGVGVLTSVLCLSEFVQRAGGLLLCLPAPRGDRLAADLVKHQDSGRPPPGDSCLSWLCRRTVPWGGGWPWRQEGDELRTADLEQGAKLRTSRRT